MPFREMTIVLHDVYYILGIPVDGAQMSRGPVFSFVAVGFTLFVDKTRDRVSSVNNCFLKSPEKLGEYAWGAGALAFLYRQLGIASHVEAKGLTRCLTLLQYWIYDHFPSLRPRQLQPQQVPAGEAGVLRWRGVNCHAIYKKDPNLLGAYRAALDSMTARQVNWTPYGPSWDHPTWYEKGFRRKLPGTKMAFGGNYHARGCVRLQCPRRNLLNVPDIVAAVSSVGAGFACTALDATVLLNAPHLIADVNFVDELVLCFDCWSKICLLGLLRVGFWIQGLFCFLIRVGCKSIVFPDDVQFADEKVKCLK
ncbi:unnamed protein product, partial [Linum tenue]